MMGVDLRTYGLNPETIGERKQFDGESIRVQTSDLRPQEWSVMTA
jgi:hypothetical protein